MSCATDQRKRFRLRPRLRFRRRTPPGAVPGTVVPNPAAPRPTIHVFSYGPDGLVEQEIDDLETLRSLRGQRAVTWVDVQGLGDAKTIRKLGEIFGLHPLALEDSVNTHQRPKAEDYDDHWFVVARMLTPGERTDSEQISLFFGEDFVLTLQERPGDSLSPVRERIRKARGRIRNVGADYLAYALLDAVVDAYFPALEQYGERLEELDEQIASRTTPETIAELHRLRSELLLLRRAIWPFRDAVDLLAREPSPLVTDETRLFLRDCYDHTVQIIDLVETCREMCADLRELYLSTVNNRMSEVMKVLTIIATIFIPLSFVAGLYGMNFDPEVSAWNMPELRWPYGYGFALGSMAVVAAGQLLFFWRRGWLGR